MRVQMRPALVLLVLFAILTGLAYPLFVTVLAQVLLPGQADGQLIYDGDQVIGSALIGQHFGAPTYFWGRPSATQDFPYNALYSGGSNLSGTNPALVASIQERIAALRIVDPDIDAPIPVDLVTASGSGLDPHISVAAAYFQVPRVARARGLAEDELAALVDKHITGRQFGLLGEPRVNVLLLNLDLDATFSGGPNGIK